MLPHLKSGGLKQALVLWMHEKSFMDSSAQRITILSNSLVFKIPVKYLDMNSFVIDTNVIFSALVKDSETLFNLNCLYFLWFMLIR